MNEGVDDRIAKAKNIAMAALCLWVLSLFLPAFDMDGNGSTLGFKAILVGLLYGWMGGAGIAVYANVFFLFSVSRLLKGRAVVIAPLVMIVLGLTAAPFPVVSWGWGAVLWAMALLTLGVAALVRLIILREAFVLLLLAGILAIAITASYVRSGQMAIANDQEKTLYLSRGMAFTNYEPCGIATNWPEKTLIESSDVLRLEIDPILRTASAKRPALKLPPLHVYEQDGYRWTNYMYQLSGGDEMRVRSAAKGTGPILRAQSTPEGAVIKLMAPNDLTLLYEQRIRLRRSLAGKPEYCPASLSSYTGDGQRGYDEALERALGAISATRIKAVARLPLKTEHAGTQCNPESGDIDGVKGLRWIDGREAAWSWAPDAIGFCSESYVVLASNRTASQTAGSPSGGPPYVEVFDRATLRPLAFFLAAACPAGGCQPVTAERVAAVRIEDNRAVLIAKNGGDQAVPRQAAFAEMAAPQRK